MKKIIFIILILLLGLTSCIKEKDSGINPDLDLSQNVTIRVIGSYDSCRGIEELGNLFKNKYPNCQVVYESLQNYTVTSLKRLEQNTVDIFFTNKIGSTSTLLDYSYDFLSSNKVDLSEAHEGLVTNFININGEEKNLYNVPVGGEVRGVYTNVTLLKSLGLQIPKNYAELLTVCETVKQAGNVVFFTNPDLFAQQLVYPYICNNIAHSLNYTNTYNLINNYDNVILDIVQEPTNRLYKLVENGYYNYEEVEKYYTAEVPYRSTDIRIKSFLNILLNTETNDYEKIDDLGRIAFMMGPLSEIYTIDKIIEQYDSKIEYKFILAPMGDEGGYAYLSPTIGIAVNKYSENLDWSLEFIDFFFEKDNNKLFADYFNCISNTEDAFNYMSELFDVPGKQMSHLGQATFDYGFYNLVNTNLLIPIAKSNKTKYLNPDTNTMYDLNHFTDIFESVLESKRNG